MGKLRYFLDHEFMEDGARIELLSIGIACEDGREYYACDASADLSHANPWVQSHVLPHLPPPGDPLWKPRGQIAREAAAFLLAKGEPEVWGYYADYDWVLFCQLFGRMVDLPDGLPQYCLDLKQLSVSVGSPRHPPQTETLHHALHDARYERALHAFLTARTPPVLTIDERATLLTVLAAWVKTEDARYAEVQAYAEAINVPVGPQNALANEARDLLLKLKRAAHG